MTRKDYETPEVPIPSDKPVIKEPEKVIVEREVTLSLINEKINYLISLMQKN
jgi:hypothetical protein